MQAVLTLIMKHKAMTERVGLLAADQEEEPRLRVLSARKVEVHSRVLVLKSVLAW